MLRIESEIPIIWQYVILYTVCTVNTVNQVAGHHYRLIMHRKVVILHV